MQMSEPSPRRSRLASESSSVPHVLHRKQSMCHLLPAGVKMSEELGEQTEACGRGTHLARKPCLPPISAQVNVSKRARRPLLRGASEAYLSATLARVYGVLRLHGRFGRGRLHGGQRLRCAVSVVVVLERRQRHCLAAQLSKEHPEESEMESRMHQGRRGDLRSVRRVGERRWQAPPRERSGGCADGDRDAVRDEGGEGRAERQQKLGSGGSSVCVCLAWSASNGSRDRACEGAKAASQRASPERLE